MSKAKIYFRLRTNKGTKPQQIYLVYRFGKDDKILYPTGLTCAPQFWNDKTSRPRDITENTTKDIVHNRLNDLQNKAEKYILTEKAAGHIITKDKLRDFLNKTAAPEKPARKSDFLDYLADFTASADTRLNPATGRAIVKGAVVAYKVLNELIQDFAEQKKRNYTFADIDLHFYTEFVEYLQGKQPTTDKKEPGRTPKQYATNTIGRYIKLLKVVLNDATEKGINTNLAYKSQKFKAIKENSESVYLTPAELAKIAALDLTTAPELDRVRDLFMIAANTGLRYSDFTQLTNANIKQTEKGTNIVLTQKKTGGRVVIPANKTFLRIWGKYAGILPPAPGNTKKFNDTLVKIGRLAGIDTPTIKHITIGGEKQTITGPKYEFISAHTARRSFATNLFLSGVPSISIMKLTGHKSETAFLSYIKVSEEQHAELVRKDLDKIAIDNEQ